jgi:putative ABC transport system permease protein
MLLKNPGFTAIALITLALGIGVNTGLFSVLNGFMNMANRLDEPDRLVSIYRTTDRYNAGPICPVDWLEFRAQTESFADIGLYRSTSPTLTGQGEPEQVRGVRATANLLPLLGLDAQLGRLHTEAEDSPASERVVLLTDRLWERKFACDPDALGRTIVLDDKPHTIIGVLPPEFRLEGMYWYRVDVLTPAFIDAVRQKGFENKLWAIGRLKQGTTLERAQGEMSTIAARLADAFPETNAEVGVQLEMLMDRLLSPEDHLLFAVLLAAVGLVLLIACVNLANLLVAKATARGRELAVRAALGAGRARIIRQLMTESLLLAALGGVLGVFVGIWAVDVFMASQEYMPLLQTEVGLSWPMLLYALVISGLAAVAFGLTPALTATRISVSEALKEGQAAASAGRARNRLRNTLIVGQLAISLPLLICCGLTVRHVLAVRNIDLGYDTERLLTAQVELPDYRYMTDAQQAAFYREALDAIEAMPGIESAGATLTLPVYSRSVLGAYVTIEGHDAPVSRSADEDVHGYLPVTPGLFRTLDIPLIRGRFLTDRDHADGQPVAVINERMARRYWPDEDPIGKQVTLDKDLSQATWITIVGVVADTGRSFYGGPPAPTLYVPHQQRPSPRMCIMARTAGDPIRAVPALRSAIHDINASVPIQDFRTLQDVIKYWTRDDFLAAGFLGGLAILALSLASIGLYGVMSYSVQQRTHEIGVRVALGAGRREIMRMILKRCLRLAAIGIGVGLVLSIPVGLAIESQLYGINGIDPTAYVGVSVVLLSVAALAGYLPARRATKIDPMVALRCE